MASPIKMKIEALENQAIAFDAKAAATTRTEADYSNPFDVKYPAAYYTSKASACRENAEELRASIAPRLRQCMECGNYVAQCICAETGN